MEGNRDEALRARAAGVSRLVEDDFGGAKSFVLEAQRLYPELEGISQMLMVVNIHVAAATDLINGTVPDWYRVLDVDPLADDDAIKRQYKRLALILHPDKNHCMGAKGAFQLLSEAHTLLKDLAKREEYDKQRTKWINDSEKTAPEQTAAAAAAAGPSEPKARKTTRPSKARWAPTPDTIWIRCSFCAAYFEYPKKDDGRHFECRRCNGIFLGKDLGVPMFTGAGPVSWSEYLKRQNTN